MVDFNDHIKDRQQAKHLRELREMAKPTAQVNEVNEFDDAVVDEHPLPTFTATGEDGSDVGTENLNITFDDAHYEDDYKRMKPPTGNWLKNDRWDTFKRSIYETDRMPGDKLPNGRLVYTISGLPEARTENGVEHQPMFFIRLSPDVRFSKNKPAEYDLLYKLFQQVKNDVYLGIHGEKMVTEAQLKYFLEEDSYLMRTGNGDSGVVVYDIKMKREPR